jgi:hypothetical protein
MVLTLACILFGSAFQYSFSESQGNEENSIPFLLCVIQEPPSKEKYPPHPVQEKRMILKDAHCSLIGYGVSLSFFTPLISRWVEADKIRDPPSNHLAFRNISPQS